MATGVGVGVGAGVGVAEGFGVAVGVGVGVAEGFGVAVGVGVAVGFGVGFAAKVSDTIESAATMQTNRIHEGSFVNVNVRQRRSSKSGPLLQIRPVLAS